MNLATVFKKVTTATVVAAAMTVVLAVSDRVGSQYGVELAWVGEAVAQEGSKAKKTRRTPAMSEKMFKAFAKVADYASPPEDSGKKPDLRAALSEVKKLEKNCSKCNAYELAQVYNYYGWIYYSLEDTNNAIKYYRKVIEQSPNISLGMEVQTLDTIAKLSFSLDDYKGALEYHDKWMKIATLITASAHEFRAQVYYQMKRKKDALTSINKAINMTEAKGNVPKDAVLTLQRALYIEKEDYAKAAKNLEKTIRHYPKKTYWVQLSGLYGILEQSKKQIHALDAVYLMDGVKKEQQILNLAYLYIGNDYPYRAAKILEKALADKQIESNEKNLELLARTWSQAKETKKAIPVMARAAKLSKVGDLYGQLVALYVDLDDNKNAVEAGKKALDKGKLKRPGEVHVNMGVAYVNLKKYKSAVTAFENAKKDKKTKRIADSWLTYAKRELYRQEQLDRS